MSFWGGEFHRFFNLCRRCPAVVPEMSRRCPGVVPEMSRRCPGDVPEMSRRCPGDIPEDSWMSPTCGLFQIPKIRVFFFVFSLVLVQFFLFLCFVLFFWGVLSVLALKKTCRIQFRLQNSICFVCCSISSNFFVSQLFCAVLLVYVFHSLLGSDGDLNFQGFKFSCTNCFRKPTSRPIFLFANLRRQICADKRHEQYYFAYRKRNTAPRVNTKTERIANQTEHANCIHDKIV